MHRIRLRQGKLTRSANASTSAIASPISLHQSIRFLSSQQPSTSTSTSALLTRLSTRISRLSSQLNLLSGYDRILSLKQSVSSSETQLSTLRAELARAKSEHSVLLSAKLSSQGKVNDLLSRKMSWDASDVRAFTELIDADLRVQASEGEARVKAETLEGEVEREWEGLTKAILKRYHEEHIWAERMRTFSSTSQLVLFGGNLIVFLLAMLLVEPWKRRKMVAGFEEKVEQMKAEIMDVIAPAALSSIEKDQDSIQPGPATQKLIAIAWPTWESMDCWDTWRNFVQSVKSQMSQPVWTGFQLAYTVSICGAMAITAEVVRAVSR